MTRVKFIHMLISICYFFSLKKMGIWSGILFWFAFPQWQMMFIIFFHVFIGHLCILFEETPIQIFHAFKSWIICLLVVEL